jgi:hypothetical protein
MLFFEALYYYVAQHNLRIIVQVTVLNKQQHSLVSICNSKCGKKSSFKQSFDMALWHGKNLQHDIVQTASVLLCHICIPKPNALQSRFRIVKK